MFALSQLCLEASIKDRPDLLKIVDTALDWIDAHHSPTTGLWSGPHHVSASNAMAATFHFTFFFDFRLRKFKYFPQIIDSCLDLQNRFGFFSEPDITNACLDYDALDLLAKASVVSRYRSADVHQAFSRCLVPLLSLRNLDGGFSHTKYEYRHPFFPPQSSRLLSRLRLTRFLPTPRLLPARGTYRAPWDALSCKKDESNAFSTWFRTLSFVLAKQREWLSPGAECPLTFRRLPFLGYHNPALLRRVFGL